MTSQSIQDNCGEESQGVERASCLSSSNAGQLRGIRVRGSSSFLVPTPATAPYQRRKTNRQDFMYMVYEVHLPKWERGYRF